MPSFMGFNMLFKGFSWFFKGFFMVSFLVLKVIRLFSIGLSGPRARSRWTPAWGREVASQLATRNPVESLHAGLENLSRTVFRSRFRHKKWIKLSFSGLSERHFPRFEETSSLRWTPRTSWPRETVRGASEKRAKCSTFTHTLIILYILAISLFISIYVYI